MCVNDDRLTCPDFDLCSNCYREKVSAKDHTPAHRMLAVATPEDAEHLLQEAEVDEENELAIGLRVCECFAYDITNVFGF